MTWSVIRKATDEDYEKLEQRAEDFCKRHEIDPRTHHILDSAYDVVEAEISFLLRKEATVLEGRKLKRLWLAVVCRALKHHWAEGIAYGNVGFEVK